MTIKDVLTFANTNPTAWVATIDGNRPRVRGFWMWFADESGFYFHTGKEKPVGKQLLANPNIELCFHSAEEGRMMRVEGTIEEIRDDKLTARLLEERPFLKQMGATVNDDFLFVFRVTNGKARFWTMETNLDPNPEIIEL